MDEIFQRIRIAPMAQCLIHEGTYPKVVDQLAAQIENDGIMKNPIIVTEHQSHFVILDGMHRYGAIRQLQIPDILVFTADYFSPDVILESPFTKDEVLKRALAQDLLPPKSTKHRIANRPLRVDLDLSVLRDPIDLAAKNHRLQEHLRRCLENNRVRFYPESVYLFAD